MDSGSSETIWKRKGCFHTAHSLHYHHLHAVCVLAASAFWSSWLLWCQVQRDLSLFHFMWFLLLHKTYWEVFRVIKWGKKPLRSLNKGRLQHNAEQKLILLTFSPLSPLFFLFLCLSEIIDDLSHLVDKTDDRIRNETRRVKLVETKSASCGEPSLFYFTMKHLGLVTKAGLICVLEKKSQLTYLFLWIITKHQVFFLSADHRALV